MDIHRYHIKIKGINLFNWKKKAIFFPRKQNQKAWALNKWDVLWKKGLTTAAKLYRTYAFSNTENLFPLETEAKYQRKDVLKLYLSVPSLGYCCEPHLLLI